MLSSLCCSETQNKSKPEAIANYIDGQVLDALRSMKNKGLIQVAVSSNRGSDLRIAEESKAQLSAEVVALKHFVSSFLHRPLRPLPAHHTAASLTPYLQAGGKSVCPLPPLQYLLILCCQFGLLSFLFKMSYWPCPPAFKKWVKRE